MIWFSLRKYELNKIKHLKIKLIIMALVVVYFIIMLKFFPGCWIKKIFGIPCPTCGMTRAWFAAFRLDFGRAFSMHPMFWSVPILVLYVLAEGKPLKNEKLNWTILGIILAGFMINYLWKLMIFF